MEKKTSLYSHGEPVKSFKKLATYVLDSLVSLISTLIIYLIIENIVNVLPLTKKISANMTSTYDEIVEVIENSGISKADQYGNLLNQERLVDDFIYGIVYDSLKENNVSNISETTYEGHERMSADKDYAYKYFVSFKKDNISDYDEVGKDYVGFSYYKDQFCKKSETDETTVESYFSWDRGNGYILLNLDIAKAIDEYFRTSSYQLGSTYYTKITDSYGNLLAKGINDIQTYYRPYISLEKAYTKYTSQLYTVRSVELFIAYLLGMFVGFMLFPLIFKDGQTLSMKVMKIGAVDKEGYQLPWYRLLIKYGVNVIEYLVLIPVTALVFYGTDSLDLIGSSLFLNISYLSLGGFSLIALVLSFILTFLLRNSRQSLSEYLSGEIVRGSDVFYIEEDNDKDKQDGNGKR